MPGILAALLLSLGAVALLAGAIVHNQLDPTISTALTVPLANLAGSIIALVGMAISFVIYRKHPKSALTTGTMVIGITCAACLLVLIPLSDLGCLSRVR